jgi:hypothetical protein
MVFSVDNPPSPPFSKGGLGGICAMRYALCALRLALCHYVPNRYCAALTSPMGPVIIVFPPGAA